MKLIHCKSCDDVVKLIKNEWRTCLCGDSGGQYNIDLQTATIGGNCDVIGIPNPFFDEVYKYLIEENGGKDWFRKKHGWGSQDIWYGEGKGDTQIHRIESGAGPRLQMKIDWINPSLYKLTFEDDERVYVVDGEKNPEFVMVSGSQEWYEDLIKKIKEKEAQTKKLNRPVIKKNNK